MVIYLDTDNDAADKDFRRTAARPKGWGSKGEEAEK